MANYGSPRVPMSRERLMRRIWDGQQTRERLLKKISRDPHSVKVPVMQQRADELDLSVQLWKAELERMGG